MAAVLVGRSRQRTALEEHLRRAGAGCGGAVVVSGEAGAGKSRLVGAANRNGVAVLAGGCVAVGGEPLPNAPFVELLRSPAAGAAPGSG